MYLKTCLFFPPVSAGLARLAPKAGLWNKFSSHSVQPNMWPVFQTDLSWLFAFSGKLCDLHLFSRHSKILPGWKQIPILEGKREELLLPCTGVMPPPDGQPGRDRDTAGSSAPRTGEGLPARGEKGTRTPRLVLPTQHHPFANPLPEQSSQLLYLPEALEEFIVLY